MFRIREGQFTHKTANKAEAFMVRHARKLRDDGGTLGASADLFLISHLLSWRDVVLYPTGEPVE